MQKFGKIVCGVLKVPQNYPCSIMLDGVNVKNPTEEQLLAAGYLPIEEKAVKAKKGKVAIASYAISADGTKIVQSWSYVNEPEMVMEAAE